MNLCTNCKYFRDSKPLAVCAHPKCGIDPVYGHIQTVPALLQRSDGLCISSSCGKEGRWFEQKEVVVESKPWWMWYRS
jgi:hypothetical protein